MQLLNAIAMVQTINQVVDVYIKILFLTAQNNFSFILKTSQSAEDVSNRLRALPRHVRDQHEWEVITEKGNAG